MEIGLRGDVCHDMARASLCEKASLIADSDDLSVISLASVDTLNELQAHLDGARDIDDFRLRVTRMIQSVGLDYWGHCYVDRTVDALDLHGNFPKPFVDQYAREDLHHTDLMVQSAQVEPSFRIYVHSEIVEYIASAPFSMPCFASVLLHDALLKKYKINECVGITIPLENKRVLFKVASKNRSASEVIQIVMENVSLLRSLVAAIESVAPGKFRSKFHDPSRNPYKRLTAAQIGLLAALQMDLALGATAAYQGISITTANLHIANAKAALSTYTLHGAVLAAIREGYLMPLP